jgi:hypothetical protein
VARSQHFEFPTTWSEARDLVVFGPIQLATVTQSELVSLAVHIRDHKRRDLPITDRTLEAYYDDFTFSQRMCATSKEAKRMAVEISYGPAPRKAIVGGGEARVYEGELDSDDDEALPPVVVWHADEMFYLLAGRTLDAQALLQLAERAMTGI